MATGVLSPMAARHGGLVYTLLEYCVLLPSLKIRLLLESSLHSQSDFDIMYLRVPRV